MIQVIPSIAIHQGKVIRMRRGDKSSMRFIDQNPLDLAKQFADCGIEVIHLVDYDGTEKLAPKNYHVLETLASHVKVKWDYTGGVHTDGDVVKLFEFGANYVTAASVAVIQPELFASWIISFGREKITLGADIIDAKKKQVAYRGWQKTAEISFLDHLQYFYDRGLKYAKCTDISRDGVLEGPNFEFFKEVSKTFPELKILASGGVRGVDDIKRLNDINLFGVIFGQAYYEGRLKLKELEQFIVKSK